MSTKTDSCPICGSPVSREAESCENCGHYLKELHEAELPEVIEETQIPSHESATVSTEVSIYVHKEEITERLKVN
jgi:hypothetical protein